MAGGFPYSGSAELYNPAAGTLPRWQLEYRAQRSHGDVAEHGLVLIAAGRDSLATPPPLPSCNDPATGTFTPTSSLNTARVYHMATLLPNGTVLMREA